MQSFMQKAKQKILLQVLLLILYNILTTFHFPNIWSIDSPSTVLLYSITTSYACYVNHTLIKPCKQSESRYGVR